MLLPQLSGLGPLPVLLLPLTRQASTAISGSFSVRRDRFVFGSPCARTDRHTEIVPASRSTCSHVSARASSDRTPVSRHSTMNACSRDAAASYEAAGAEWGSAGFRPSPAAACSTATTRPRPASEALTLLHIVSHSASVPARPASAVSRVAPARLTRAFSGPVTVLPGG
jgi:hypothetical protein